MFYDNFTPDQVCGLFSAWHFVAIGVFFISAFLAIYFSKKLNEQQAKKIILIIAIISTVLEVIKIAIRIYKKSSLDSWIPLYLCSLFIFAIWFFLSKNSFLKNMGGSFMVFGGISSAFCFIIYPSTSLMIQPIWHPGTLHSLIYHWMMLYSGFIIILKKLYIPHWKHFFLYLAFVCSACLLAVIINHFCLTNMMFMSNPFGLPILSDIAKNYKWLYMFLVFVAQSVLLFWASWGLYSLILHFKTKKGENHV